MVQIRSAKEGSFELTDRSHTLTLSGTNITLEDQSFNEPGEYEAEGIEIVYGNQAALIVWEKIQMVYLFNSDKPASFEKNQFSPCNVMLVGTAVDSLDKPKTTELLETYDPSIVAFSNISDIQGIQDALKIEEKDLLKITEATLPVEGRELYKLI